MPTGFYVETGSDLSKRLLALAPQFLEGLKRGRLDGRITPTAPVTGREICKRWKALKESSEVRALVSYWRERGEPIASEGDGYFYALTPSELEPTMLHLRQRMSRILTVTRGLQGWIDEQNDPKRQVGLFT